MADKFVVKVQGMSCSHCERRVEAAVTGVAGVLKAKASAKKGEVIVKSDDASVLPRVRQAIREAGYEVSE